VPQFQTIRTGDWVPMMRKLLLGIRRRAEQPSTEPAAATSP
jgi:hypothetical protein